MQVFLTKTILVIALFALLAGIFDTVYFQMKMNSLLPELVYLNEILEEDVDVILFGSSVNEYTDSLDTDKRSIAEMLDGLLPSEKVKGLSHTAYHLDIFAAYIAYISKKPEPPLILVPLNVRSFCPAWDLRPTYQFTFEKHLINNSHLFLRFIEINKSPDQLLANFKKHPVFFQDEQIGTLDEFVYPFTKLSDPRKGFIINYMQPIKEDNQKLASIEKIIKVSQNSDIQILFYYTPIDYTKGNALQIDGFEEVLALNAQKIREDLDKNQAEVYDLSQTVDSSFFSYPVIPNEHLNQRGRMYVAQFLAEKVRGKLSEN